MNFLALITMVICSLELLAKFDPFLAKHIETHGNKGRGHVSYLSSTICDEFILIMGNEVIKRIVDELKLSKYYPIIVDSTPDVSKIDQLTLIVRYILPNGTPIFLNFCRLSAIKVQIYSKP